MIKVSWRKLQAFAAEADAYLNKRQGETKFGYALKRVRDQITKHSETLQSALLDIEIDLCVVDEKDVIQRDAQGNLQFTRAAIKERNQRQRKLMDQAVEIEPYFATQLPADLTLAQLEAYSGLILADSGTKKALPDEAPVVVPEQAEEAQASAAS